MDIDLNLKINSIKAVTKSVIFFLIVYLGSIGILAGIIGNLYYYDQRDSIIEQMRISMRYKIKDINAKLEYYHLMKYYNLAKSEEFVFAEDGYDIALYNKDKELIASTFTDQKINFNEFFYNLKDDYYLVESLNKQYLGVKYIVIKKPLPVEKIEYISDQIFITALYAGTFLVFIALLLSKIMLYPLKNLITSLKTFIKNSTHEMNTPISTILMSYEHFDKKSLNTKQLRALDRIEIATKTLSNLYNDLTYLSFHEHIEYQKNPIDVKEILLEQLKYMDTLIRFKGLTVACNIESVIINIDKRKLILLIDNLLSNAIKFSKKDALIEVELTKEYLKVKDYGIGIAPEDQKRIFKRFETSNGYGIGLDIVSEVCKEHNIKITLESEVSKGSEFKLIWPKTKIKK